MLAHGFHARVVDGAILDAGPEGPVRAYPLDALPAIVPIRVANQHVLAAFLAATATAAPRAGDHGGVRAIRP